MRSLLILLLLAAQAYSARLSVIGFEAVGTAGEGGVSGSTTPTLQSSIKRSGAYAMNFAPSGVNTSSYQVNRINTTTGGAATTFGNASLWIKTGFYYATKPGSNSEEILALRDSGGIYKVSVRLNSTGTLSLYSTGGLTLLATGTTVLSAATWYEIELRAGTGATAAYELRIDGTTELSGTGDQGTNNIDTIRLGKNTSRNSQTVDYYFDDVVIDDAGFPGTSSVSIMKPNATGTYTAWSAVGAASDWDATNEVPASNTEYILSPLVNDAATTVNMESTSAAGISGTIKSVKSMLAVVRDAATNGAIRPRVRSGSSNSETSTNVSVTSTSAVMGLVLETDPATGIAWTTSGLDAVEVGVINRSTAGQTRVNEIYLMVEHVPSGGGGGSTFPAPILHTPIVIGD